MPSAETARLIASLELKDQFSGTVNKALGGLAGLDRRIDRTQSKAFQAGQHIGIGIRNVARLGLATAGAAAGIVTASLKVAGDFEAQLNTINTIARATPTELAAIGDGVRKIARDTGTGLADLTQGYYDLLSAGVKVSEAQGALTAANTLAIGGLSTTAEAVDLLTTALNVYGGGAQAATKDADIFAKVIERGKVTASDLAGSFSQVGAIAKSSGISLEELAAGYARITANGGDAAEASTQIRSAIIALTKVSAPLEKLQKTTGRNYLAIAGKQGLVAALEIMRKDAEKAGVPLVDLLGRVEGLNFTLATTGPNFAAYNADLAAMGDATGTAAEQMAERNQGLNFQVSRLKAIAKDAGITIGTTLLPKISALIGRLNEFVSSSGAQKGLKDFGSAVAGLFTDANIKQGIDALKGAFQVAKDAAPAIASAAKITGSALKLAVDAFKSLPPEIQSIAIAGLAINKLTGGLVTNLAGGLIEAVVKRLVSAVVNVNGAVVNVVGLPGVGPGSVIPLGPGAAAAGTGLGIGTIAVGLAAGTAIAALGIMGLGWLIQATSSPEQFAATNLRAQQQERFKRSGGTQGALPGQLPTGTAANPIHVTAGGFTAGFASSVTPGGFTAGFGAKGTGLFSGIVGTLKTSLTDAIKTGLRFHDREFYAAVAALKAARKPEDVQKAVAEALRLVVGQRRGNALATSRVLVDLKDQLLHTTDPETRRILKAAIAQVEHKLVGRQLVQKQIDKADKIFHSSESTGRKIADLKVIEKQLERTSKTGAQKVQDKIDALKRTQKAEQRATTEAIKDKDLSVKVSIPLSVYNQGSTLRETIKTRTTYTRVGNVTIS